MGERLIKRGAEPKVLALLMFQQGLFLAGGLGLWLWSGASFAEFLQPSWQGLALGVALAAGLAALLALVFLPRRVLLERIVREQGGGLFSTERPWGLGAILLISAAAGIGEEALFRGGLQTFLGGFVPGWAAILLASALFTLAHPGSRLFMAFVGALSLAFGLAYHLSNSLVAVMVAHALLDVFGCLWVQRELRRLGHWQPAEA